ncbi:MAG TPA: purine-nucleoside phosphorylase [Edaphobacter sp.]|nr:purine-nucleoside phosphorylase [Edaphobacter sp.]
MTPTNDVSATDDLHARAVEAAGYIRSVARLQPHLGLILGSGLGDFADHVQNAAVIPYSDIPNFPISTVPGHSGRLVLGEVGGVSVIVMQGRVHAYEGYSMAEVTFPTRVLGMLGVQRLIVTNAAGGINSHYSQGAIVAISDHINFTGRNAVAGPNEARFGPRFFDMTHAYSPRLRTLARDEAQKQGWTLDEGVYIAVLGPSYETPAEIRAFRTLGADLVGMSTVHEVIAARHMGIEVLGLSVVTNMAAGVVGQAINHEEVMETGRRIAGQFTNLLTALIPQLASDTAAS